MDSYGGANYGVGIKASKVKCMILCSQTAGCTGFQYFDERRSKGKCFFRSEDPVVLKQNAQLCSPEAQNACELLIHNPKSPPGLERLSKPVAPEVLPKPVAREEPPDESPNLGNSSPNRRPGDCLWGKWTDWGACSMDCGGGSQSRTRPIEKLPEGPRGRPCGFEAGMQLQTCNEAPCITGAAFLPTFSKRSSITTLVAGVVSCAAIITPVLAVLLYVLRRYSFLRGNAGSGNNRDLIQSSIVNDEYPALPAE